MKTIFTNYFKVLTLLFIFSQAILADWNHEQKKIEYLLNKISNSNLIFIRNDKEYSSKEAAGHLRMKLKNAMSSWFAPDKSKWTATMFIDKVASKSFLSGKAYFIKLKNGKKVTSAKWLKSALDKAKFDK